jgi:hypothetical protein
MPRKRGDGGVFVEDTSHDDVLAVFGHVEGPVVTSGDVADALGCTRETARRKLDELYEQGRLGKRKTAGRVVYWKLAAANPDPVNPNDPFFADFPTFATGDEDLSERVDEILYGKDE